MWFDTWIVALLFLNTYEQFPDIWLVQHSSEKMTGSWGCSAILKIRPEVSQLHKKM